jgi:alkylation response protein AidB-like acyl-CoA dehydrogenase
VADTMASGHVGGAGLDTDSLTMMLDAVAEFVAHALPPQRQLQLDHEDVCPEDTVRAMSDPGQLGVQLVFIPAAYGGMDGGAFDSYRVCEVMARHDIGLATAAFATFLGSDPILVGATDEQKQHWLGAIAEKGIVFAYGATEPDAGSDLGALKTTAERIEVDGVVTGYRINGRKQWISNGSIADVTTILARTPDGPSWFTVPKGTPGFSAGNPEDKHGLRLSNTAALYLDNVEVPADHLIGGVEGKGLVQAQMVFGYTRVMVAAFGLGGGWSALDRAIAYSLERQQGGGPLAQKQGYTHKLIVPHAVRLEAARSIIESTADRLDRGLGTGGAMNTEGAIAKLMATEAGNAAADAAIQAHGGYGYTREYVVEKIKRDVRITTIYEGTSEIMEMTIARDRWQLHLKTGGAYYRDRAAAMNALHRSASNVGAAHAGLALQALAAVLEACRVARLTRNQHVLLRLGELICQAECAEAFAQRAADALAGKRHPKSPDRFSGEALATMSRVFARDAAQKIGQEGVRWVAGAVDAGSPDVAALLATIPHDAIRAAQAGLLADMDRVADILYDRAG